MATMTKTTTEDGSLLDKLDDLVPAPLAQFDAFPKLPATYKARSESRGFLTLFVAFAALLLVLNDLGEFVWGWTDYEFGVDIDKANTMDINVDMVVNMPCQCESSPWLPLFSFASFICCAGLPLLRKPPSSRASESLRLLPWSQTLCQKSYSAFTVALTEISRDSFTRTSCPRCHHSDRGYVCPCWARPSI